MEWFPSCLKKTWKYVKWELQGNSQTFAAEKKCRANQEAAWKLIRNGTLERRIKNGQNALQMYKEIITRWKQKKAKNQDI